MHVLINNSIHRCCVVAGLWLVISAGSCHADEIVVDSNSVLRSIEQGRQFLLRAQLPDGSWRCEDSNRTRKIDLTSFALTALMNAGGTPSDEGVRQGLEWLREPTTRAERTHEMALMIEAFATAKDRQDFDRIRELVRKLEAGESSGGNDGSWSYGGRISATSAERNYAHLAAVALREAQELGIPIRAETWMRTREHWISRRNPDGGWGDRDSPTSSGGITAAAIAYLISTDGMLQSGGDEVNADDSVVCCGESPEEVIIEDACRWLGRHFAVGHNPQSPFGGLYYLYALERAGRLTGRRFFKDRRGENHDWYREGCEYLLRHQDPLTGAWVGASAVLEDDSVMATSYALHFLSKGMAPVLFNKLQWARPRDLESRAVNMENKRSGGVRNLIRFISTLDRWPRALAWQDLDISQATVVDLLQAPILYLHGSACPEFSSEEVHRIKEFVSQGGLIFAIRGHEGDAFDEGFRELVRHMYPSESAGLKRLDASHPVFRSEYPLLDADTGEPTAELWGLNVGCRTGIIYSPDDLSCLWEKRTSFRVLQRTAQMEARITNAVQVGVNVASYATGRNVSTKLGRQAMFRDSFAADRLERDVLQIAQIRVCSDSDAAPQALYNLVTALHRSSGMPARASRRVLSLSDRRLFDYPLTYAHGRSGFTINRDDRMSLRRYLTQGGFLFADACCGDESFDASFRRLMIEVFPEYRLSRIPAEHEIFTPKYGYDLTTVSCRHRQVDTTLTAELSVRTVEPFLEGIEIEGRFVVVYSKFDLSCALHRQSDVECSGYISDDAARLGVNVVLYSLLQ